MMVNVGFVRSTATVRVVLAERPSASVTCTASVWSPSGSANARVKLRAETAALTPLTFTCNGNVPPCTWP
ncbi:hypothetical protein, partial [Corallococcus exiguus]|uniref:hypothetical protein n=1 Tax=Corallococcus exiguus TaxID=83462 RepID=UPI0011214643